MNIKTNTAERMQAFAQAQEEARDFDETYSGKEVSAFASGYLYCQLNAPEPDAALAAIERVRAIHKVKHGEKPRYAADDYHAEREPVAWEKYSMCEGCSATWPCATIAALDGAPEPEWEWMSRAYFAELDRTLDSPITDEETARAMNMSTTESNPGMTAKLMRRRKAGPWEPVGGESE